MFWGVLSYTAYLSRSKIEYVFKFLKEGLGWEKLQIQDFNGSSSMPATHFAL